MDEINLAAAETLECLSGLLEDSAGSLVLLDRGDTGEDCSHSYSRVGICCKLRIKLDIFTVLLSFLSTAEESHIIYSCISSSVVAFYHLVKNFGVYGN